MTHCPEWQCDDKTKSKNDLVDDQCIPQAVADKSLLRACLWLVGGSV
jgi:hypothetical protein